MKDRIRAIALTAVVLGSLSWISFVPPKAVPAAGGPEVVPEATGPLPTTSASALAPGEAPDPGGAPVNTTGPAKDANSTIDCAARRNGGVTDTGVSATRIRLASNVVTSGPGSSFLGEAPVGMDAVVRRVNASGGICGRLLDLAMVNDGWDAARGRQNIEDFVREGHFALPVMPSSEGLSAAIRAGVLSSAGIPVVGTEGLRKEQYDAKGGAAWVWPVAVATVSQVRIMARYAYDRGARSFGIAYDRRYKFGVEGADAFAQYVRTLGSATLRVRTAIEPSQTSYKTDANQFLAKCDPCDAVVLLLDPETAKTWIRDAGAAGKGRLFTMGAQPLFSDSFARGCGQLCNEMLVWTGYNPAIGENVTQPGIARYIDAVRTVRASVDVTNQFTQGAYLGMEVFVRALTACSATGLTRGCVRAHMDALDLVTPLAAPLRWRPGSHFANAGARAYSISYTQGSFTDWRDEQTGFVNDPTPGVVPG